MKHLFQLKLWFSLLVTLWIISGLQAQTCPANLGTTVPIASLPYTGTGLTTCGAGNDITSSNATICGSNSYYGGEDLVFTFTPTSSGAVTLSISSSSSWIGMMLYNGCPFLGQGGTCVSNIQSSSGSPTMTAAVTAGTTYYLVVDTWPTPTCIPSFNLTITAPVAPPSCPGGLGSSVNVTLPYNGTGLSNCGAGNDLTSSNVSPICGSNSYYGGEDQVYIFTPTASGPSTITFTSASSWAGIMLYSGCPLSGNGAACVAQAQSSAGNQTLNVTLAAGVTYYLIVDSWPSPTCHPSYNLSITAPAAAYDACTSISTITCGASTAASFSGSGSWSVTSCGFSTPGQEKVYSFTPTTTGMHTLNVPTTNSGGYVDYFYKVASGGCSSSGWTCIDDVFSGGTSATFGPLTAGTTYYIMADPEVSTTVTQTFQINCPSAGPANDNCANATPIACGGSASGSTSSATTDGPSTDCNGGSVAPDVWYSFAGNGQLITASLCTGTTYDSQIDVYTGTCGSLTNIGGCSDDFCGSASQMSWISTVGTTYYIRVHGFANATGNYTLNVTCAPAIPACVSAPIAPANGGSVCAFALTTLDWADVVGATSYDVYFGTTPTPPFLVNVAASTYNVPSLVAGTTYYWQVLPKNGSGTASGCAVWSFTVSIPPVGATQSNPIVVGSLPYSTTGNNLMNNCWGNDYTGTNPQTSPDVYYRFVVPTCTQQVSISLCGSSFDTYLHLLDNAGTWIASNDDNGPLCTGNTSSIRTNLAPGTYYAVVEGWNTTTGNYTLNISAADVTPPTITCNANVTANNTPGQCGANVNYTSSASDACGAATVTYTGPASGGFFPVGTTTVVAKATDNAGNTATCSFTVTIIDNELPTVTCAADKTVTTDIFGCVASNVNVPSPIAVNDNCGIGSNTNNAPAIFPLGETVVTFTISDPSGNSATCSMAVTVADNQAPALVCPEIVEVTSSSFDCSAVVNYDYTVSDNCGIDFINYSDGNAPGSTFEGGDTWVTITAYDVAGWPAECSFWVSVRTGEEVCDGQDNDCDGLTDEADKFEQVLKVVDNDGSSFSHFGNSVAIHEDWAVVGNQNDGEKGFNAGAAYIMHRSNGSWGLVKKIFASDATAEDQFGHDVAIHNGYAVVAANLRDDNGINTGAVYVFGQNEGGSNNWGQAGKLNASDAESNDNFGASVSYRDGIVVVGASLEDESGADAGAAYVFNQANGWAQEGKLMAGDAVDNHNFGGSVSNDGDYAVVGASNDDANGDNAGAAYVFHRSNGAWAQVKKLTAANGAAGDWFGFSVDLDEENVLVGANRSDYRKSNGGAAYVYHKDMGGIDAWGQTGILFAYDSEIGDQLGYSVALHGNVAIAGARNEDAKGSGAGAIYVYHRSTDGQWGLVQKLVDASGNLSDNLATDADVWGRVIVAGAPLDDNGNMADLGSVSFFEDDCDGSGNLQKPNTGSPTNHQPAALSVAKGEFKAFPVPFNESLNISVNPEIAGNMRVTVMNTLGQEVAVVFDGYVDGATQLTWQAANAQSGAYQIRIETIDGVQVLPVILSKQ